MNHPNHRAQEYDALNDHYARFLIEEILPEVGKKYRLTDGPENRAIGGTSSGAICAWTIAWERPDQFRKVISMIGSFTSIGYKPAHDGQPVTPGGRHVPDFNPDESHQADPYFSAGRHQRFEQSHGYERLQTALTDEHGNWRLANEQMLNALEYANVNADRHHAPGPR